MDETVQGTSQNLPSSKIWIFVSIFDQYFPMPKAANIEVNGDWLSTAYFGEKNDPGNDYVIYVTLVDQTAQDEINTYNTNSRISNNYPGMDEIPLGAQIWDRVSVTRIPITDVTITFPSNNSEVEYVVFVE